MNEYAAEICARWPNRFRFFAALPLPVVDSALDEIAYGLDELGASGVAIETSSGGRYLSDAAYEPVFAELDRRASVAFVPPESRCPHMLI